MKLKSLLLSGILAASVSIPSLSYSLEMSASAGESESVYNSLLTLMDMKLQQTTVSLTAQITDVNNAVNSLDDRVENTEADLATLAPIVSNLNTNLAKLKKCVEKQETACEPDIQIKPTAFRIGRYEDSGKLLPDTTLLSTSSSDSLDSADRIYTYRSDIKVSDYPYCAIAGSQGLSWKYNKLYRGTTYWEVKIEEWTNGGIDRSDGSVQVECFTLTN